MNWHSLVIIGIIVILFIILMIINATATDLDQEEKIEEELSITESTSSVPASTPDAPVQNQTNTPNSQ